MGCSWGPQPDLCDLSHCERCLGRAVGGTCSLVGGMRDWTNKDSYIHLLFGSVDGTSRKQRLESLATGKQGWHTGTMGCRQLTEQLAIIFGLFYFAPNRL